ncbi:MAG: isoprenylcysteine carboxylmethyltransferase family protein [Firmicutes bacterium]|nr:isoprenylcysteine carboxylmethyltransferase family protein [Bacillota bacterium]
MQGYFLIGSFVVMILAVLVRSQQLRKLGIKAVHFGKLDKKDFIIPPFVLLYFYLILANIWDFPRFEEIFVQNDIISWIGVAFCVFAPVLFIWGIISFGKSFRVGVDNKKPNSLVTGGAFAISRNPLYLAFFSILLGAFLIFPMWTFFGYFVAALWLIDRQVCLEENFLKAHYGAEYDDYCGKVRRYL